MFKIMIFSLIEKKSYLQGFALAGPSFYYPVSPDSRFLDIIIQVSFRKGNWGNWESTLITPLTLQSEKNIHLWKNSH